MYKHGDMLEDEELLEKKFISAIGLHFGIE